ncbi:MAG: ImmA/IrrE family metallo-endopeptidase [Candidatus Nomurabacteria bacterium]|nr:ImmA/IrrE family metallo-endopeptidase [Candidatus Nomurabacteria bacterium]
MEIDQIKKVVKKIREKYNKEDLSPFPFDRITIDNPNLKIEFREFPESLENISGVILFSNNEEKEEFSILINSKKPKARQYFTLAHELGHFFLHKEHLKKEKAFIDDNNSFNSRYMLFRDDNSKKSEALEVEANKFAANLIMPEDLVKKVWGKLNDVEDLAKIFNVSVVAMSIRLERLGLID